MDTGRIVISHPDLGAVRALVHPDSLPGWAEVGWVELGPWCGEPGSMATADEHAAARTPETPSTPTPKRRRAAEKSE